MRLAILLALPCILSAQLIPAGQPIPKGPNPPAVFLNGYLRSCTGSDFAGTFGGADKVLQASQIVTVLFDNCSIANRPSIEALGVAFGQFLAGLRYTDGSTVSQVDIVAHSMGGLIVRSYLAGKQDAVPAAFAPPATPPIRKAIFLATPHFGTAVASLLGAGDQQTQAMQLGSQFLFDLNTWNEGTDDLRGVDALAVVGNGGTGLESSTPGFDDGVVQLTSASIGFARPGRTRVVAACHTSDPLVAAFGACLSVSSAPPIANIADSSNVVGQIIISFLTGANTWQTLGEAIESNPLASTTAGVAVQAQDLNGIVQTISSGTAGTATLSPGAVAFKEALPAKTDLPIQLQLQGSVSVSTTANLPAGTSLPVIAKPGPVIKGAVTAGSVVFPLNVAADGYVAIYGSNLTTTTTQEAGIPYPNQLGDVQVLVNGSPAQVQYISSGQLNIVYPHIAPGLAQLTVKNSAGQHTVNALVAPAVPSVFTLDGTNNGPAAALNASVAGVSIVGPSAPLHAGDYVALFTTGLGLTEHRTDGLDWAQIQPTVTVGGQNCRVTYAGIVPGYTGFDQINCVIPAGVSGASVPVIVTSSGRPSNTATLAIQ
jgi:uncharacterized protein (TIGR03437 family)